MSEEEYVGALVFDQGTAIPSIDMGQPIVRCRDCEYIFHREYNNGFEYHTCGYFDSEHAEVTPEGFCAWGERREDA